MENSNHPRFFQKFRIKQRKVLKRPKANKLLTKNLHKGETPAVGSYSISQPWIKHSFSSKQLSISPKPLTQVKAITSVYKKSLIKPTMPIKPSTSAPRPRPHGIWEDFPLYSTPQELSSILSFKPEKQKIEGLQLNISKSLKQLQELINV